MPTGSHLTATSAWKAYEPSAPSPWNLERVVHLHRRAAFAAPWAVLQRDLQAGPAAAIDRLLDPPTDNGLDSLATTIGDAAMASGNPARLKAWWLYRMLLSPDPLRERITLMWHNHFATSNRKVQNLIAMREQNDVLRTHALATFGELLSAVVKQPAMLTWLDADSNRKGHPNENLARELMELFTLGVGNYTEQDVREAARALTGWTIASGDFVVRDARHDEGTIEVLGERGPLTGDDLLALLLGHPATSERLAWRLCHTLLGEGVTTAEAQAELARDLREHNLDIRRTVEVILRSEVFFSEDNMHSRVIGPMEYMIGMLRALELCDPPPSTLLLAEWGSRMGQDLFYPPNVGGWNEGRAWLSSRAIIARANFAEALAEGELWRPARRPDISKLVQRNTTTSERVISVDWLSQLLTGAAIPADSATSISTAADANNDDSIRQMLIQLLTRPESYLG